MNYFHAALKGQWEDKVKQANESMRTLKQLHHEKALSRESAIPVEITVQHDPEPPYAIYGKTPEHQRGLHSPLRE